MKSFLPCLFLVVFAHADSHDENEQKKLHELYPDIYPDYGVEGYSDYGDYGVDTMLDGRMGDGDTTGSTSSTTGCTGPDWSLADVAPHNHKDDCWIVIDDGVFEITAWINGGHPGGLAPEPYCGSDATAVCPSGYCRTHFFSD